MESSTNSEQSGPHDSVVAKSSSETRALLFAEGIFPDQSADGKNLTLTHRHVDIVRETLGQFKGAEEIGRFGNSFLIVFALPSEAARFSLRLQAKVRAFSEEVHQKIFEQISFDVVEAPSAEKLDSEGAATAYEQHAPLCHRLAALTNGKQVAMTRPAFDEARRLLKKEEVKEFGPLQWMNHGPCQGAGIESPIEVCEIREGAEASAQPPGGLERVAPKGGEDETTLWGWRPGPGCAIPGTRYVLDSKFGEGRLGEEWSGGEQGVKERRLFKFCFRSDWVRMLKEKEAVFQLVKAKLSQNRNVLAIFGFSFDQPPHYIVTESFEGTDLITWAKERGGVPGIPFPTRLELAAQAASGLQGAHESRILHRDLRPEHILVMGTGMTLKDVQVKLTNFGIGQIGISAHPEEEQPAAKVPTPVPGTAPTVTPADASPPAPADRYKAPEVIEGKDPTTKSEVYSLGVIVCQLVLGNLSECLTPQRMKEIVAVFKRDGLLGFFNADPQQRTEGASRLAGELRAVNKDRDNRPTGPGITSRREVIERIVMASLCGVAVITLAIYGPKYLRRKLAAKKNPVKKPDGTTSSADNKDSEEGGKLTGDEDRSSASESDSSEDSTDGARTKHRPASAVREQKKKEEVKESAEMLFKLIVFPIAIVVIIGTVVNQFGPAIKKMLNKNSS